MLNDQVCLSELDTTLVHLQMSHIAFILKSTIFQLLDLVRAKTPANKTRRRNDLADYHRIKSVRLFST